MKDFGALRNRLETLSAGDTARWGVMTAAQAVCHVRDAFGVPLETLPAAKAPCPIPRGLMKFFALRAPLKWPPNVPTIPELKVGTATAPGEFGHDLAGALAGFDALVAARSLTANHPIFGAMSTDDWRRWGWLHVDHHLRQFGR